VHLLSENVRKVRATRTTTACGFLQVEESVDLLLELIKHEESFIAEVG
jgi:hypothetical protein